MVVSILHRATGQAMAFGAVVLFTAWLAAAATGEEAYASVHDLIVSPLGWIVGIGLTLIFFQHMMSGIRHLVMDTGSGYELRTNLRAASLTMVGSVTLTVLMWGGIALARFA